MIILLNGCINAGKSTVALALVRLLKDAAHIELDDLRHCMPALPFEERVFAITLEAAVALTRVFVPHGLHCVLTWPLGQHEYDFLVAHLQPLGQSIHAFTLGTDLDVLLTNRVDGNSPIKNADASRNSTQTGRTIPPSEHCEQHALDSQTDRAAYSGITGYSGLSEYGWRTFTLSKQI